MPQKFITFHGRSKMCNIKDSEKVKEVILKFYRIYSKQLACSQVLKGMDKCYLFIKYVLENSV